MKNHVPFRLKYGIKNKVIWVNTAKLDLSEPFFDENIVKNLALFSGDFVETELLNLFALPADDAAVRPNGFIFHMSRCGSTLLANMLRSIKGTISVSEPGIIGEVLDLDSDETRPYITHVFKNIILSFGQKHFGDEANYVVKMPSDATLYLPVINDQFAKVPKVFLYRNPAEVLVSVLDNDPAQEIFFNPRVVGRSLEEITQVHTPLENAALALSRICERFLDHFDPNTCMAVNYARLADRKSVLETVVGIADFFNMKVSAADRSAMEAELGVYAKDKRQGFQDDRKVKAARANNAINQAVERYLDPVYQKLESLRCDAGFPLRHARP